MENLFLDSANLDDIRACLPLIDGVTINQSLLAKEPKRPYWDHVAEIRSIIGPERHLSIPDIPDDEKTIPANTALKVPVSSDGLKRILQLHGAAHESGSYLFSKPTPVLVNATCIYTPYQAIMASRAGADFLSVFVGRINDKAGIKNDAENWGGGYSVIAGAKKLEKKIIAGSIRTPLMARMAWDAGAHIVTTSRAVIEQMANDEGSKECADKFERDYQAWISQ